MRDTFESICTQIIEFFRVFKEIDDFFSEIEFEDSDFECEYSTVGGWAIEELDADPHIGDSFTYQNLCVIVTEMDDMRITQRTVLVNPVEDEEE